MLLTSCVRPAVRLERLVTLTSCSSFHTSATLERERAGKYRVTVNRTRPLTYEMAFRPQEIATKKGFNSFNTAQLVILHFVSSTLKASFINVKCINRKRTLSWSHYPLYKDPFTNMWYVFCILMNHWLTQKAYIVHSKFPNFNLLISSFVDHSKISFYRYDK